MNDYTTEEIKEQMMQLVDRGSFPIIIGDKVVHYHNGEAVVSTVVKDFLTGLENSGPNGYFFIALPNTEHQLILGYHLEFEE